MGSSSPKPKTGMEHRMSRKTLTASFDAPQPIGPYSIGAAAQDGSSLIFLSGQTPIDPVTGALIDGDITAQTEQVFRNLAAVLHAAGRSMTDVVKANVYLTSMSDFADMNDVYGSVFEPPYPARTTVAVAGLPLDALVEIELIVAVPADPAAS